MQDPDEGVAARGCSAVVAVFDTGFFKALCEPARISVLRQLILLGRADIGAIAPAYPRTAQWLRGICTGWLPCKSS